MLKLFFVLVASVCVLCACGRKAQKTDAPPSPTHLVPAPGTLGAALPPNPAMNAPAPYLQAVHLYPSAEDFEKACAMNVADIRARLAAISDYSGPARIDTLYRPYNEMMIELKNGWQEAALLEDVDPSEEIRAAAEQCALRYSRAASEISLSRPLYDLIDRIDTLHADAPTKYSVFKTLRDFHRAGVDKDEATRKRIALLVTSEVEAGQAFERVINEDVRQIEIAPAELAGLPPDFIAAHRPGKDGKVVITTRDADYTPFMTYGKDDAARKALRLAERDRGFPANEANLKALLAARYALAKLLDYPDYASYVMQMNMAGTPERAQAFLDEVSAIAKPAAARDMKVLLGRLHKTHPEAKSVGSWQCWYLRNLVREERYAVDAQKLRSYFQFANVKVGLLKLAEDEFGLRIKDWKTQVWDPHVSAYEIFAGKKLIGRFYLDLHPRTGKYQSAAQYPVAVGIEGEEVPIDALVANVPGAEDPSALLEHEDVVTLLHAFGQLLRDLLSGHGEWVNNGAADSEIDFAEAPSLLWENWAYDPSVLRRFAVNSKGERIPQDLVKALDRARDFGRGIDAATQVQYAAVSLDFYRHDPAKLDLAGEAGALERLYSPFPPLNDTHFYDGFSHLNEYSASYYSYQWSLAIAADLFTRFEKKGLMNPGVNRAYRKTILEPGSSAPASDLVDNFLGRPWSTDAYREWLERGESD